MSYWHGDEWRWFAKPSGSTVAISVIDRSKDDQEKASARDAAAVSNGARVVPFGFGREAATDKPLPTAPRKRKAHR